MKRSVGLICVAMLLIVWGTQGALGALYLINSVLSSMKIPTGLNGPQTLITIAMLWNYVLAPFGRIIGGVGLLRPNPWARHLSIWVAILSIVADGARLLSASALYLSHPLMLAMNIAGSLVPNGLVIVTLNSRWVKTPTLE